MANLSQHENYGKQENTIERVFSFELVVLFLVFLGIILIINLVSGILILCTRRINKLKRPPNIILASLSFTEGMVILQLIFITIMMRFAVPFSCVSVLFLYQMGRICVLIHVQVLTLERIVAIYQSTHKFFKWIISTRGRIVSIIFSYITSILLIVPIYLVYGSVSLDRSCDISELFGRHEDQANLSYRLLICSMLILIVVEYICLAVMLKHKLPQIQPGSRSGDSVTHSHYGDSTHATNSHHGDLEVNSRTREEDKNRIKSMAIDSNLATHKLEVIKEENKVCETSEMLGKSIAVINNGNQDTASEQRPLNNYLRNIRHVEDNTFVLRRNNDKANSVFGAKKASRLSNISVDEHSQNGNKRRTIFTIFRQRTSKNIATTAPSNPEWRRTVFRSITFIVILTAVLCLPYLVTQILKWVNPAIVDTERSRVINNIFMSLHALLHGIVHLVLTIKCKNKHCCCK